MKDRHWVISTQMVHMCLFICFQVKDSIIITGTTLVDNKVGVMPMLYEPNALSHQISDKFVRLENSLVVGMSPDFECGGIDDVSIRLKTLFQFVQISHSTYFFKKKKKKHHVGYSMHNCLHLQENFNKVYCKLIKGING